MLANVAFVLFSGLLLLGLSATPALFRGDLSPTLLVISFVWGVFMGILMLRHYGSAAAAWRRWTSPPG
jgi:hypothetical protein